MERKPLIVDGKKMGSTSDFLDNFYSKLPSRLDLFVFLKLIFIINNLHCPRPNQSSLAALHRPESCKVQRRLNGWYGGGGGGGRVGGVGGGGGSGTSTSASTYPPSSRPMSSLSRSVSHNDVSRPSSSLLSGSISNNDIRTLNLNPAGRPRWDKYLSRLTETEFIE